MSLVYLVPQWFFGVGILLEIVFAIAAALVAFYAFRVFYLSGQREIRIFSLGFVMISLSYFIKALVNLFVISEVKEGMREISLANINLIGAFGVYTHMFLFIAGLVTLAYMTFKKRNRGQYLLLLLLSITPMFYCNNEMALFSLVSSVLSLFMVYFYFMEYKVEKNKKTSLTLLAFVMLFLSGVSFIFAPNYYVDYVIGHILELASYILLVTSLVSTIRKK